MTLMIIFWSLTYETKIIYRRNHRNPVKVAPFPKMAEKPSGQVIKSGGVSEFAFGGVRGSWITTISTPEYMNSKLTLKYQDGSDLPIAGPKSFGRIVVELDISRKEYGLLPLFLQCVSSERSGVILFSRFSLGYDNRIGTLLVFTPSATSKPISIPAAAEQPVNLAKEPEKVAQNAWEVRNLHGDAIHVFAEWLKSLQ
jgi:hypothetical protein